MSEAKSEAVEVHNGVIGKPKGFTILAVDDEPHNLMLINSILRQEYRIKTAPDGVRALAIAAEDPPPDLILLDIIMPKIDGFEVCRQLQQELRSRDIPVIFLTARNEKEHEIYGLGLGAVDYITKPVLAAQLKARIRVHLELSAARKRLAQQNQILAETVRLREEIERLTRHDLKGPLSGIITMSEILLQEIQGDPQLHEKAAIINRSGYRILQMIDRSLDLYKMETGRYQLQAEAIELPPLLERVWRDHERVASRGGLDLVLHYRGLATHPATLHFPIWGEDLLLYTLFSNLLINAIQAAPPGTSIVIDLQEEGEFQRITLTNHGVVPIEIRDRFFEKYATHGKRNGNGLGSYSAQLITHTHGGTIAMESSDCEETTRLTLRLPRIAPAVGLNA